MVYRKTDLQIFRIFMYNSVHLLFVYLLIASLHHIISLELYYDYLATNISFHIMCCCILCLSDPVILSNCTLSTLHLCMRFSLQSFVEQISVSRGLVNIKRWKFFLNNLKRSVCKKLSKRESKRHILADIVLNENWRLVLHLQSPPNSVQYLSQARSNDREANSKA